MSKGARKSKRWSSSPGPIGLIGRPKSAHEDGRREERRPKGVQVLSPKPERGIWILFRLTSDATILAPPDCHELPPTKYSHRPGAG